MFHYFRVSENIMLQRVVTIFCRAFFCLTLPKKSVEEPFCAVFQNISVDEKDYGRDGGGYGVIKIFRRKFFASECRNFS